MQTTFTQSEIGAILWFFGKNQLDSLDLGEGYFLEESYISHASGDRLSIDEMHYIVSMNDGTEETKYPRNFLGLAQAVEELTRETA